MILDVYKLAKFESEETLLFENEAVMLSLIVEKVIVLLMEINGDLVIPPSLKQTW